MWEAKKLDSWQILEQVKSGVNPAYKKDPFYCQHSREILNYAKDAKKRKKIPTKRNVNSKHRTFITIKIPRKFVKVYPISVDDVDSFAKVKKIGSMPYIFRAELEIKSLFKKILKERGSFKDWPGEPNDLFTYIKIKKKRHLVAFAFKGKSKKNIKKLRPKDMGKNGDQIYRMFMSPASVFFVQFVGQIDESVLSLMKHLAISKSYTTGNPIFYGIINGDDTSRIFTAYT